VEPAIAVEVREYSAAANVIRGVQTRSGGHIFKSPLAEVPIKCVAALQAAQEDVRPAVAIEITHSQATAVFQDTIRCAGPLVQNIRETDSGLFGRQLCKPGFPLVRDFQLSPLYMSFQMPIELPCRGLKQPKHPGYHGAQDGAGVFHLL